MATASEEFLVRLRYWLVSGGRITRIACGTTISRSVAPRVRPSEARRFHLALVHGQHARAHDLADEGRRIDREREQQRDELRDQPRAAREVEAAQHRHFKRDRLAENQRRQTAAARSACRAHRARPAAGVRSQTAAAWNRRSRRSSRRMAARIANTKGSKPGLADRPWNDDAAIVEKEHVEQRHALPRRRQRGEHGQIPEQDLEQQRQVADQFDVAAGQPRHQPVRRQPSEADNEAEDRRKEDADHRDQQRVQQTDDEDARVAVRFLIRDQAFG